jgi:hypothetical protein
MEGKKMINPPICEHSLDERETACADGMCPLCMAARIRELEAERDAARKALSDSIIDDHRKLIHLTKGQRNAIIERCLKAADVRRDQGSSKDFDDGFHAGRIAAVSAIRALLT